MRENRNTYTAPTRGWQLIQMIYLLLLGVSAIGFLAPSLETREGRWGVGLAFANLALVILGTAVTWFAYRQHQRWVWWVVLATGLCYGVPMTLIDHIQVGWIGPVSILEFLLLTLWGTGLILGSKTMFGESRSTHVA